MINLVGKLIFTANYEAFIERRSSQGAAVYPTKRMMSGDLTEPFFRAGRDMPYFQLTREIDLPLDDTAHMHPSSG